MSDCRADRLRSAKEIVDNRYANQECKAYPDFQELLARKDIDAVLIATADFQQRLDAIGMFPDQDRTPDEINAYIKAEIAKWAKVIADAGVKPAD